jgi:hypothetical protein
MTKILLFATLLALISTSAFAQSLSPNILPAGKSIIAEILDGSGNDITSQYNLSYAGTQLKITPFSGKSILIGSIAGSYNVVATKISDSSTVSLPVTVTAGAAASISILDGNNQSVVSGSAFSLPVRVTVKDSYGNFVPGVVVSFVDDGGSAVLSSSQSTTDVNGIGSITVTAGSSAERETINSSIVVSGLPKTISFVETVTAPQNLASKLLVASQSSSVIVGSEVSLVVDAETSTNVLASTFSGAI